MIRKRLNRFGLYVFLSCICLLGQDANAQRYPFYNLNVENGLIQSQAACLAQDKFGHLWIGTIGGLSRYDGKNFTNYTVRDGMQNNSVNALAADKQSGLLWIGTSAGISSFNGKEFKNYLLSTPEDPNANMVSEIKVGDNGMVWCRAGGKLYSITNGKSKAFELPDSGSVSAMLPDKQDLWVARKGGGIYRFHNKKWDSLSFNEPGMVKPPYVSNIFKDSKGQMWLTTNAGFYKVNKGKISVVTSWGQPLYALPPIYSITEDRGGAFWMGTNSGALRFKDSTVQYYNKSNGLTDNTIYSALTDAEGNVWLASDGQGVFRFSGAVFTVLDEDAGLPSAQIMSIAATRTRLYLGTYDAGLYIYEGGIFYKAPLPLKPPPAITAISIRKGGNEVWLGTRGAGLWKFDGINFTSIGHPTLLSNSITCLRSDSRGRLWVGFINGAMLYDSNIYYKLQLENSPVMDFMSLGGDSMLIASNDGIKLYDKGQISDFETGAAPDSSSAQCFALRGNELWIGTSDNGVIMYDLSTKKSLVINKSNGLQSDFIYNIITDNDGNIWAGTGYGIHKINIRNGQPVVSFYGKGQGVAGMESNHNAVFKMPDGSIWFGTTNGALHYKPQVNAITSQPISIVLQSIKVFGENVSDTNYYQSADPWYNVPYGLRLPYKKNSVTFTFQAISLGAIEQVRYRYRMEGLEDPWSDWSAVNTVTYSALPPGKYTLHVEAALSGDNAGVRELKYEFEIITPFHKTGWFRVLVIAACILLGIILQYLAGKRKQRRQALMERLRREEQNKVRQRTAEDFHDEVGNKLTRINVLTNVLKDKIGVLTPDTQRILSQIQDNTDQLYSGTRDILWSLKPSNDNLYEILHRIRDFGGELFQDTEVDFRFSGTDEKWRSYRLPLDVSRNLIMIFKEALNNALKYSKATSVILEVTLKDKDILQLVLTDNGKGFDIANFKKGHGIDNIKRRSKRIRGIIYIDSTPGKGTIINLNFRLPSKKDKYYVNADV